jgi:hypothetical protein
MSKETPLNEFAFNRRNYVLLLIGLSIVVTGFALMSGGGSPDPREFSYEIFSTRRIVVAPLVVLFGYGFIMYAILTKGTEKLQKAVKKD